jgi:hypothetical protein
MRNYFIIHFGEKKQTKVFLSSHRGNKAVLSYLLLLLLTFTDIVTPTFFIDK